MKTNILSRLIIATLFGFCLCLSAQAQSVSYFMKITGPNIPGTSVVGGPSDPVNYVDQIEVSSYSLSGAKPVDLSGTTQTTNDFEFNGLECVMALDGKAYPLMLTGLASGTLYTEIVLDGVSFAQPDSPRVFFKLEMKNTRIQSITQQGTSGDQPIVSVVFRPTAMRITTRYIKPNGDTSDPVVFVRNIVTGAATY